MVEKSVKRTTSTRKEIKLRRRTGVSLLLAFMMAMSLVVVAPAQIALAAPPVTIGADYHITSGGTYQIDAGDIDGIIYVDTTAAVTLVGNGTAGPNATAPSTPNTTLSIQGTTSTTDITLQNLWIQTQPTRQSAIDYAVGSINTLRIAPATTPAPSTERPVSVLLETNGYGNPAVIHVASGVTLNLVSSSTASPSTSYLDIYKSSAAAAIGGNSGEAAGTLNFTSGNYFIKGSQTGAVIGGDSTTTPNDVFTFGGTSVVNIEANARGAAIGGSNQGQAGDVYIQDNATVNITCDFSGPAIGHGNSGTVGGNLYWTGGSLLVNQTPNSMGPTNGNLDPKIAINAAHTPDPYTPFIYSPSNLASSVTVAATGYSFTGYVDRWMYRDQNPAPTYTPNNWLNNENTSVYLNLPAGTTSVQITDGGVVTTPSIDNVTIDYDSQAVDVQVDQYNPVSGAYVQVVDGSSFTVTAIPLADAEIATVSVSGGGSATQIIDSNQWTVSGVTSTSVITVSTSVANNVTFVPGAGTVYVNDVNVADNTPANVVPAAGTLGFTVVPAAGYLVSGFTVSASGTVTQTSGNGYQVSGIAGDTQITVNYAVDPNAWGPKADITWYSSGPASFTLTTPEQLAGLAQLVNGGNDFTGKTIYLGNDIDLAAGEWTPIGGVGSGSYYGPAFNGTFDGTNKQITRLAITRFTPGTNGYGLFGNSSGILQNFTVTGASVTGGSLSTNASVAAVAAAVGYTTGSVINVHNQATVNITGLVSSSIGGVIGIAQSTASTVNPQTLQKLSNTASVIGGGEVGGVVGQAIAATGASIIDQSYNTGSITASNRPDRSYVGGIVGRDYGAIIENSYNTGAISDGGAPVVFIGGIAGMLNGLIETGGTSQMLDSYSIGAVSGAVAARTGALWGYVDNTKEVTVGNVYWLLPAAQDPTGVNINPADSAEGVDDFVMENGMIGTYLSGTFFDYVSGITHPTLINNPE